MPSKRSTHAKPSPAKAKKPKKPKTKASTTKKTTSKPTKKKASAQNRKATKKGGRSCYIVELSVDPGGARRGDVFVYARPDHVRHVLEQEFLSEDAGQRTTAAYLAVWYGERIHLWIVNDDRIVDGIDLHAFLRVSAPGLLEGVALDDKQALAPLRAAINKDAGFGEKLGVRFDLDWSALAKRVPALVGDNLRAGDMLTLKGPTKQLEAIGSYLAESEDLPYGYSDLEGGEEPPEDWEDPDPFGDDAAS